MAKKSCRSRQNEIEWIGASGVKNSAFRISSSSNDIIRRSGKFINNILGASFGSTQIPGVVKPENLMPTLSERPVALTAMSDAAAAVAYDSRIISAAPYYNSGYSGASYAGMYAAGGTQNYYPVVSSSLRGSAAVAAAATSFPFAAAAASHAYYGNGYASTHFDYASYPATMHCYGGRSGYYGCSINPVSSNSSIYGYSSGVERSLSMGEGWGSIPHISTSTTFDFRFFRQ
ncbi:Eyes absent [Dirofilaria immitis]|nr:Eyes absent [Dirofilaria immitis]